MDKQIMMFIKMSFPQRILELRKKYKYTQQQVADMILLNVAQIKRYEVGTSQPSIEAIKRIAQVFNVSADWLIFEDGERNLPENVRLKFEAVSKMSEVNQLAIQAIIDGMILKQASDQLGVR